MKITCADFITRGDYSIKDIKDYLSALNVKWSEKGVWDRQTQNHVDKTSEKINATLRGITRSYDELLNNIDKYEHPRLHEAVKNCIVKLKKMSHEISHNSGGNWKC